MENNTNNQGHTAALNEDFNFSKMRSLISDDQQENFSEKFKNWLRMYTHINLEKIWVDIES